MATLTIGISVFGLQKLLLVGYGKGGDNRGYDKEGRRDVKGGYDRVYGYGSYMYETRG